MIISVLLTLMIIAVFFQPNAPRLFAAALFVGITYFHELFLSQLDGIAYYGSAALLDLTIVVLTSGISPVPKMVVDLQRICMISIGLNFAGWLLWFHYLPPIAYNTAFIALYAWALITLIRRNSADVGSFTLDSWHSCFRFNWGTRLVNYNRNGGKA